MADKRITDVDFIDSLNSDESFFVNQNNTIKQVSKSDVIFGIANGGTGAITAEQARTNLGVTPANIGAATSSHSHDDRYYTETEINTKLSEKVNTSDLNSTLNNYATQNWVIEQISKIAIYNGE